LWVPLLIPCTENPVSRGHRSAGLWSVPA
jgi:hypothetical protein